MVAIGEIVVELFEDYAAKVPSGSERLFLQIHGGKFTRQQVGKTCIAAVPRVVASFLDVESFSGHSTRVSAATVLTDSGP